MTDRMFMLDDIPGARPKRTIYDKQVYIQNEDIKHNRPGPYLYSDKYKSQQQLFSSTKQRDKILRDSLDEFKMEKEKKSRMDDMVKNSYFFDNLVSFYGGKSDYDSRKEGRIDPDLKNCIRNYFYGRFGTKMVKLEEDSEYQRNVAKFFGSKVDQESISHNGKLNTNNPEIQKSLAKFYGLPQDNFKPRAPTQNPYSPPQKAPNYSFGKNLHGMKDPQLFNNPLTNKMKLGNDIAVSKYGKEYTETYHKMANNLNNEGFYGVKAK